MELSTNSFLIQAQIMNNNRSIPNINIENADDAALWNAAIEFEAYFIQFMFREMRNTINTEGGILPQSHAQDIFNNMKDEQIARNSAGNMGLAIQIFNQMQSNRNPLLNISEYENQIDKLDYGI